MKFSKKSGVIKITTIIITVILFFSFLPSLVYASSGKQIIENNSLKKENIKYNTLKEKGSSSYVKPYVQNCYYYSPYIFEIGWNINKQAEKTYKNKVNITLKDSPAIKVYFDNNIKKYSKEKKVISAIKELFNSLDDTSLPMKKVLITRITPVKKSDIPAYAKKYYKKDNIAFNALFPYLDKEEQEKYLAKMYKSDNIVLFAKSIKYASKDLISMYTDKALKDDKPVFISIMLNYSDKKDLKRYAKQSYESDNIQLFSMLIWYMPETETRK